MKVSDTDFSGLAVRPARQPSDSSIFGADRKGQSAPDMRDKAVQAGGIDKKDVMRAAENANEIAAMFGRNLRFEYKEEAGLMQVTVTDTDKDEVIRKIPSDEMVRFVEHIKDLLGATFDEFL